ncbi:SRPBCC domain-containing protein [Tenacibaculum sp. IB213877]|uniref:SRPBCC family protein n=1 Tax=Tenacibaculum sp. IB213877 TaxID=3097351 RepID=UPI002A5A8F3F|nr:SRPBCC domain-containing protein [Tenacibaculum sp. IB213877]MDY0780673.1 SRPBCC domain-containing protein [Tenacibaculum sp. IB213877]
MKPIVVSKTIHQPVEKVWLAITDVNQMVYWFFDNIPDFKPEVGFKTWFIVKNEDRIFYHLWEIAEVKINKKITVQWTYPDYVKEPFPVTFELEDLGENQTKFTVIAEGIEKFSHFNLVEFAPESCRGGWEYFSDRLKKYLEN